MTGRNAASVASQGPFWTRLPARRFQFALDFSMLTLAFLVAYLLRFDFSIPREVRPNILIQLPLVVCIQYLALMFFGVYAFIWRYIGLADLPAFGWAFFVSSVPLLVMRYGLPSAVGGLRVPLSVILMDMTLGFLGVLGIRVLRRVLYERYEKRGVLSGRDGPSAIPTLLVGAGRAGVIAAREILGRNDMEMDVRGFVDDDTQKRGAVINGVKVLGTTDDLSRLVREHEIQQVVITIAKASRDDMDRIVKRCEAVPVKARIIPGLDEILGGRVEINRIRDVRIEDLLARDQVELDVDGLANFITRKVVMVTGAGGSIGSELCRQVLRFHPEKLLLVERAEPALYHIDYELQDRVDGVEVKALLADVSDDARMQAILQEHRPQLVLHAAAHKHVPLMEDNPLETIKNNVLATRDLGTLAGEHGVEAFVFISTDKAVRPTSMMGASKRLAELVVQDLDRRFDTRYVAVRFGNVLGSNGSVIPLFRKQIMGGGPVTVTHPDMLRYFMTIPEAAQLVLEAGAMGHGGEIFVLDMGEPVRIVDLAKRMITLSGLKVEEDIPIIFTGARPGEKLVEELQKEGEEIAKTRHPKIFIGRIEPGPSSAVVKILDEVTKRVRWNDPDGLRESLSEVLPEARLEVPSPTAQRPTSDPQRDQLSLGLSASDAPAAS